MDLRKLDALVAEKVMGWKDVNLNGTGIPPHLKEPYLGQHDRYENYSTDIAAAWDVVNMFDSFELKGNFYGVKATLSDYKNDKFAEVTALSGPMAICLAALKAKGIDVSEWEK